ncbi:hypothetical protein FPOAC1_012340 [Fusarium poae]|uniref:hypothetical protein n=1 Tax=Fusarium poae TaxID=36050 RepID=UPI001CE8088F|nr:hypothetical protein FPOAC1_012340 [Fusarium poae]KAG8667508.1 hypothetical protein FPOAC1_012340 [Fusarium poae]
MQRLPRPSTPSNGTAFSTVPASFLPPSDHSAGTPKLRATLHSMHSLQLFPRKGPVSGTDYKINCSMEL